MCISQLQVAVTKYLRLLTYGEKPLILAHSSGGASPRSGLGLWQGWHPMAGAGGRTNCSYHKPGSKKGQARAPHPPEARLQMTSGPPRRPCLLKVHCLRPQPAAHDVHRLGTAGHLLASCVCFLRCDSASEGLQSYLLRLRQLQNPQAPQRNTRPPMSSSP